MRILLGHEICRILRAKNLNVKAMVRITSDPSKIEQLTKLGVQVVQGDIIDMKEILLRFPVELKSVKDFADSIQK